MDREIADSFLKLTSNLFKAILLRCFSPSLLIPQIQARNTRAKFVNQSTNETNLSAKHPKTRPDSLLGPARSAPGTRSQNRAPRARPTPAVVGTSILQLEGR